MGATLRQYLAALTATMSVSTTATSFAWMEPLMKHLISPGSEVPMTSDDTSWLVASVELGEVLLTLPAGLLADRYGRKTLLLTTGPLNIASWILVLTTRNLLALYLVRFLQGVAMAVIFSVAPIYIAEISEPRIRGELSTHFQTMWNVGLLYAYVTGNYLGYQAYAYACAFAPVVFLILFSFMPESPYFLLMTDQPEAASQALSWLRSKNDVEEEFKSIKTSVDDDMKNKGGWRDLFATRKDVKFFLIVQAVCLTKYLSGLPAIVTYATQTFAGASNGYFKDHELTIGLGIILCVAAFGAAFIADSVGRRPLLIYSTLVSAIFNTITGLYYFLGMQGVDTSGYSWVVFVSVAGFCTVSNIGLGPLLQTIQAEYFPSNTRGIGGGITDIFASIYTFINVKQFQTVQDLAGIYLNYWSFAAVGFCGTIFMYLVIPETAGRSLDQIQQDMASGSISGTVPAQDKEGVSVKDNHEESSRL